MELKSPMPGYYEFFAGGGMVRAGLGGQWNCLFANDFDRKKSRTYQQNWGGNALKTADVGTLTSADLPGQTDLAWASFPCQDLSLAGGRAGLKGNRSGTFRPFWKLMQALIAEGRAPRIITLENVCGTLTSHAGRDFNAICSAVQKAGYLGGAIVVDGAMFVPQSRPRLFMIFAQEGTEIPSCCVSPAPVSLWHARIEPAYDGLSAKMKRDWIWWNPSPPRKRTVTFADLIEENPEDAQWWSDGETQHLIAQMSDLHRAKLEEVRQRRRRTVGTLYRRTREDEAGRKVQRAEVRFDSISGCLRTPAGGSSRQVVFIVEGSNTKARLITKRETARLMGLPDSYILPENYNEAYHLTGDGVIVPVVRHLAEQIFEPIVGAPEKKASEAA